MRLHPQFENEKSALEIWDAYIRDGYTPRDIFPAALHALAEKDMPIPRGGRSMEGAMHAITERLDAFQNFIESAIPNMLRDLKRSDPKELRRLIEHDEEENGEIEFSDDFLKNARNAAKKSLRQLRRDDEE